MQSSPEYLPYLIKDYKYWTLFLNTKKQSPYVGRCYAWWKDLSQNEGDGMRPSDLPQEALLELNRTIFDEVLDACSALGYHVDPYGENFLLNMAYLANEGASHNYHMHWHFIPRFKDPLAIDQIGLRVTDSGWGRNYAKPLFEERGLSEEKLQFIRSKMAKAVGGIIRP